MNQNLLKGLFILLVIMDHNDFARGIIPGFLQGFGFHVMGFMMIPFLRPANRIDGNFLQYLFRLYYPYLAIVTFMSVVVAWITPIPALEQAGRWALALYSGNSGILKDTTHMALLWFMPSFISLIILRTLIENANRWMKAFAILGACLVHPYIGPAAPLVRDYLPLGLLPALYVLPLAYLGIYLHRQCFQALSRTTALFLSACIFVLVKSCQMHFGFANEIGFAAVAGYSDWPAMVINDAEAVFGVLMLFQACRFALVSAIEPFGQYSLQIYLLHAFVALAIYKLVLAANIASVPVLFAITLVTTSVATLALARFAATQPHIRRFLFPRSWQELAGRPGPLVQAAIPPTLSSGSSDMINRNNGR